PKDDRIAVAVVLWETHGKGQSACYLTTTDWADGDNAAAEPWSAPATAYPAFQPGTRLALISYGVEGFHRTRSGDEKAFDMVLNSNGQVHHRWTPAEFRLRTRLNKLDDRIFVVVETDALPIELRTTLFTPDRSQLLANEAALQLEDQVADFLNTWNPLTDLNR